MPHLISPDRLRLEPKSRVVFLAGSIEMGSAEDWQAQVASKLLSHEPALVIANPRRANWDAGWKQSIDNPQFSEQVNWEIDHLVRSDLALFYFQPGTQSPITLMELGYRLAGAKASHTLVCCPDGFWRLGNIEIMLDRHGLGRPLSNLKELVAAATDWLGRP